MLTRRQLLQHGLVGAGAALLASQASWSYAAVALPDLQLTPFVDPLPLPPDHRPSRISILLRTRQRINISTLQIRC